MFYKQAYEKAKHYNIPHRSVMNKKELLEALEKFKGIGEVLKEKVSHNLNDVCCAFAHSLVNSSKIYTSNAVCHEALGRTGIFISECVLDVSGHMKYMPKELQTSYKEFIDYMINRSPWRDCFLSKNIEKVFDEGVYVNVEKPKSHVVCAAVALRQASEWKYKLISWKLLKEKGCPENIAWFLSQIIEVTKSNKITPLSMNGGHNIIDCARDLEQVVSFFKEGFRKNLGDEHIFKKGIGGYQILNTLANVNTGNSLFMYVNKLIRSELIDDGWYVKFKNNCTLDSIIQDTAELFK